MTNLFTEQELLDLSQEVDAQLRELSVHIGIKAFCEDYGQ
jgi:hypothetical protein